MMIRDMRNEDNVDEMKKDFMGKVWDEVGRGIWLLEGYSEWIVDGIVREGKEMKE
ncbi:hypothetical protein [Staphylococcus hominis]|uniref:hypothetical protein n=1 Tax=Staphylococcus hominis TaxID=1290 RepID=UPI001643A9B7|nr:hypothetical protein [Staphylococcus hominis]